ncbi:MAG: hypothetical protein WB626_11765, partial [Bacteroidota bacterium]
IRGTYADYIVQVNGRRYFIVEVKSMGLELSEKHLRQAVNYAANEGIDWALLTNAKRFDFYRILFTKPIDSRRVFSVDLGDKAQLKKGAEQLQYLTRTLLPSKGLDSLWHKYSALEPSNVCRLLFSKQVIGYVRRELKRSHKTRFEEDEIKNVLTRIIEERIETAKPRKTKKSRKRRADQPKLVVEKQAAPADSTLV